MAAKTKEESVFLVSLEGLHLSKEQEKRIEKGIGDLILKEIANLDMDVDVAITKKFELHPQWENLWRAGQLAGFWIKGFPQFPKGGPTRPL